MIYKAIATHSKGYLIGKVEAYKDDYYKYTIIKNTTGLDYLDPGRYIELYIPNFIKNSFRDIHLVKANHYNTKLGRILYK